jgi:hypothetical protein
MLVALIRRQYGRQCTGQRNAVLSMIAPHIMYDEYIKMTGALRARFRVGQRKSTLWIYAVPTSATSTRLIINSGTDGQPSLPWHKRLVRSLQPRCGPTIAIRQPC